MPTANKIQKVEEISSDIRNAKAVYFTDFLGLDVDQINALRSGLFKDNITMKVVKNTLIRRSMNEAGYDEDLKEILIGSTALVMSTTDPVSPAKILLDTKKKNKDLGKPLVKAVLFEGQLFGQEKVQQIADLPSRDELLSKLLAGFTYPMSTLASMLQSPLRNLQGALNALKEKKEA